jgi:hypothetical protein
MDLYQLLVFVHVLFAFLFVLAHGVSVFAAIKLRGERDPARIGAILDLSRSSLVVSTLSLLALLVAGIALGFMGGHWARLWIWVSLGLLVLLFGLMAGMGSTYYNRVRLAVGQRSTWGKQDVEPPPPRSPDEVVALLGSSRPYWLAAIGGGGLLVIIWLMYYKPF